MVIEGAPPAWLFMNCKIESVHGEAFGLEGPFALLEMKETSAVWRVPFELKNVTLGTLKNLPENAKLSDLLPAMVGTLLNPSQSR